jgi:hypothetical protein
MANLKNNLAYSRAACQYVLKTVGMEAANWDQYNGDADTYEDCVNRGGGAICAAFKDTLDMCVYDVTRPKTMKLRQGVSGAISQIRIIGETARRNKCGNCGEFSALAFIHLFDKGVRTLDWMSLEGADHAFVVIGRTNKNANDHDKWGSDAVICDPWGQGFRDGDTGTGTYRAVDFKRNMGGLVSFTGVRSLYQAS